MRLHVCYTCYTGLLPGESFMCEPCHRQTRLGLRLRTDEERQLDEAEIKRERERRERPRIRVYLNDEPLFENPPYGANK